MPLVNTKKMLKKAYKGGYAVGAFNVTNMETIQAITEVCDSFKSPVILAVTSSSIKYAGFKFITSIVNASTNTYPSLEVALHLDHGSNFEICKHCIDEGFTSVMIDGSHLDYKENIKITKKVTEYAHLKNVSVEGELGRITGIEDEIFVSKKDIFYTDPSEALDFVKKTGIDSLAVSIGTSHGINKFSKNIKPHLEFEILSKIEEKIPNFPMVLHGSSTIDKKYVENINKYGGNIKKSSGIPENILKIAANRSICKINIDSDIRLVITSSLRKYFMHDYPSKIDPRGYLGYAKNEIKKLVEHKIKRVLGSTFKT